MRACFILPVLALLLHGCGGGGSANIVDFPTDATLKLTLNHRFGGQAFTANDTLRLPAGDSSRVIVVRDWRYIVSMVTLVKPDGVEIVLPGYARVINALAQNCTTELQIPVPSGSYTGVKFYVGLDSATNHQDVTVLDAAHPLHNEDMHWHWAPELGYKFMYLVGTVDTTAAGTGPAVGKLEYHIALDRNLRLIKALEATPLSIAANGSAAAAVNVDLRALFAGIHLQRDGVCESMGSEKIALSVRLANNFPAMFQAGNQVVER
jgi:hypothetical protein